jgi:hypothetical protein
MPSLSLPATKGGQKSATENHLGLTGEALPEFGGEMFIQTGGRVPVKEKKDRKREPATLLDDASRTPQLE